VTPLSRARRDSSRASIETETRERRLSTRPRRSNARRRVSRDAGRRRRLRLGRSRRGSGCASRRFCDRGTFLSRDSSNDLGGSRFEPFRTESRRQRATRRDATVDDARSVIGDFLRARLSRARRR
jgi:hypothetical protein